jgi:hypothetical protein
MSDVITIGINNLFQSFDPVRKTAGNCLECENSQNLMTWRYSNIAERDFFQGLAFKN